MNDPVLLAVTTRSGHVESEHFGRIALCDSAGALVWSLGDAEWPIYLRSAAKPFQAVTCVALGARARFGWTDAELAILCASHFGEASHRVEVRGVLAKAGLSADHLQCGPHPPIAPAEQWQLLRAHLPPQRIHNNCSGKHAGMLASCRVMDWPIDGYLSANHPLQQANRETLARFCGLESLAIELGIDGCGVPTFHVPLGKLATAFARLANPGALDAADSAAARQVVDAMTAHPFLIGGTGAFNSELVRFAGAALVAKNGAEGVFAIGLRDKGLGIAIKIADGNPRAIPPLVLRLLAERLGSFDWPAFAAKINPPIENTRGESVGTIEAAF